MINRKYYDPNQNPEQRRAVKKSMRSLMTRLNDSRAEYLQPNSMGLVETLHEADNLFKGVVQTSDATIDSRMLVTTADLSYKKIRAMTQGDSSVGIDVDDFISRCVRYMKDGDIEEGHNTQSQRRRRRQAEDDDEDGDTGEPMNWRHLGRNLCFLHNSRPCLTGFLLGPLSVQKKVRQQTQRRAKEVRAETQALRPVELTAEDLDKNEQASLTEICTKISALLDETIDKGLDAFNAAYDALPDEELNTITRPQVRAMMRQFGVNDATCVPLFDFCVNPKSFGQTVENFFYVSFLIKEGRAGIYYDSDGIPGIVRPQEQGVAEKHEAGVQRNQTIFSLSYEAWEEIVKSFGIKKSIIPHREEDVEHEDGVLDPSGLGARPVASPQLDGDDGEDSDMYG
jgi:non-structural maintenance of chromosomes element 4